MTQNQMDVGECSPFETAQDRITDSNTLGMVRELVTVIQLVKYTGAPASRAEELVLQIATSVEGISEVATGRGDESPVM